MSTTRPAHPDTAADPVTAAGTSVLHRHLTTHHALLSAALHHARRGLAVFPLHPGTKRPAVARWEDWATRNPTRITAWWRAHPEANIGIACGPSRLLVVDCDVSTPTKTVTGAHAHTADTAAAVGVAGIADGVDVLAALAREHTGTHPWTTHLVDTPGSDGRPGLHLYFRQPRDRAPEALLRNTTGRLGPLLDTRGAGGYVVAAGSRTPHGTYRTGHDIPPAPLPAWLLHLLDDPRGRVDVPSPRNTPPQPSGPGRTPALPRRAAPSGDRRDAYLRAAVAGEARLVAAAPVGTRNRTLFGAALTLGRLVAAGELTEQRVRERLEHACAAHLGADGFTAGEAAATITSGLRAAARNPRTLDLGDTPPTHAGAVPATDHPGGRR